MKTDQTDMTDRADDTEVVAVEPTADASVNADPAPTATADAPADAADRVRDAEEALRTFYERVIEVERELATETARANRSERKLWEAESRMAKQAQALAAAEMTAVSERDLRERVAELDGQIARAHEEIQALHNSRTMRAVAIPRRVYAKLRSLVR